MEPIRVLIAEDHGLVLAGIPPCSRASTVLRSSPRRATAVRRSGAGRGPPARCPSDRHRHAPDERARPGRAGERVAQELPATRVVILSMHTTEEYASPAVSRPARWATS